MALIMFENRIAKRFEAGKTTTIRQTVKPGIREGGFVDLGIWTGKPYRSKTKVFGTARIRSINRIEFSENHCDINDKRLNEKNKLKIATVDGFDSWAEFVEFFRVRKTDERIFFSGFLIQFSAVALLEKVQ